MEYSTPECEVMDASGEMTITSDRPPTIVGGTLMEIPPPACVWTLHSTTWVWSTPPFGCPIEQDPLPQQAFPLP